MQQIYVLTYLFDVDLTYYNTLLELKQMLLKQPALSSVVCIFFFSFRLCVCAFLTSFWYADSSYSHHRRTCDFGAGTGY
jgi:hypothetical protein